MTEIRFTLPADLEEWVMFRVADGGYASVAEYLFDLVRRDMKGSMPCK